MYLKKLDDVQRRAVRIIKATPQDLNIDPQQHRRTVAGLGLMYRLHTEEVPGLLKTMLPPSWILSRFTRESASFGNYAVQCLTGKTESGHWSLDSYIPTIWLLLYARNMTALKCPQFGRSYIPVIWPLLYVRNMAAPICP